MRSVHIILTLFSLSPLAESNCLDFWKNWKTCPSDQFPDMPRDVLLCYHELAYTSEVLITKGEEKQSAILCHNKTFASNIFDCLPIKDVSLLILKDCPFPPSKFNEIFGNENSTLKQLQIHYENVGHLQNSLQVSDIPELQLLSVNSFRSANHFNLILESVPLLSSFSAIKHNFTTLPERPFRNVPRIQILTISEGILEILHDDIFYGINPLILDLSLNRLKEFSPTLLQNLDGLKKLNLSHNCIETVDYLMFENTPNLEIISLDYNNIATLPSELFRHTPNITVLLLNHNRLKIIPETVFNYLHRLQVLSLNNNNLSSLPADVFGYLDSLLWLDLQVNQISTLSGDLFDWLSNLHVLDLSDNKISSFLSPLPFGKSKLLSRINISGNYLEEFPDVHWFWYNISQLDVSRNSIRKIVLPVKTKHRSSIFLQNNLISTVTIKRPLENEARYFMQGNPFHCNCSLSDFIHFMPYLSIGDENKLKCHTPWYRNHKDVRDFSKMSKLCETKDDCPSGCQCYLSTDNKVTLDCRNLKMVNLPHSFPPNTTTVRFENNDISSLSSFYWLQVTHLYLSNNSLTSLHNWTVPPKLEFLAIDGNKLTDLSSDLMEIVDNSSRFRIYMADNKWTCDCRSAHLKQWLMRNLLKVQDSTRTYCGYGEKTSLIVETRLEEFVCSGNTHVTIHLYKVIPIIIFVLLQFSNKL